VEAAPKAQAMAIQNVEDLFRRLEQLNEIGAAIDAVRRVSDLPIVARARARAIKRGMKFASCSVPKRTCKW